VVVTAHTRLPARAPVPLPRVRARPPSGNFFPTHRTARARPTVIARVAIASSRATPRVLVTVLARGREPNDARGTTRETERWSEGDASIRIYVVSIARRLVSIARSRPSRVSRARFRRRRDAPLFRDFFDRSMDGSCSRWRGTHRPVVNPRCMGRRVEGGEDGRRDASCGAVRCVM